MERGQESSNWIPSELGIQQPDFDGYYRAKPRDPDDLGPRDKRGFQPLAILAAVDSFAIGLEIGEFCESPIERDLAVALTKAIRVIDDPTLLLGHQFWLGRFRYDLSIHRKERLRPLALIECDGKEFHSTEDQIATDRLKNALAAEAGIILFRFTGSEIFRELDRCVMTVFKELRIRERIRAKDWDALEAAGVV